MPPPTMSPLQAYHHLLRDAVWVVQDTPRETRGGPTRKPVRRREGAGEEHDAEEGDTDEDEGNALALPPAHGAMLSALVCGGHSSNTESSSSRRGGPELDVAFTVKLAALLSSPSNLLQPTLNIGVLGHVAHGKTTLVNKIQGVTVARFRTSAMPNVTVHMGFENAKIYRCSTCAKYQAYRSDHTPERHSECLNKQHESLCCEKPHLLLQRHVCFLDCPGHEYLLGTMLGGASLMDSALLLVAANEPFPQPQAVSHLHAASQVMGLDASRNLLVVQNKLDLIKDPEDAEAQCVQIKDYFREQRWSRSSGNCPPPPPPVIPISAQLKMNLDLVLEYICHLPVPVTNGWRRLTRTSTTAGGARLIIHRSFDANKPGEDARNLRGGVLGASVRGGIINVGQEIEIRPGVVRRVEEKAETETSSGDAAGSAAHKFTCSPLRTKVVSLMAEGNRLDYAIPGGLIQVGTTLDPSLARQNKLTGHIMGEVGSLPDVFVEIDVQLTLLTPSKNLKALEALQLNLNGFCTGATVASVQGGGGGLLVTLNRMSPVCAIPGDRVAFSRRVERQWRLIGWGTVLRGVAISLLAEE